MTLLEAMSFSKPSIATAVGGTPEILSDNETGLLTSNNNEAALAHAISSLASNGQKRADYGHNARVSYEQRFALGAMATDYEALYRSVMG